MRHGKDPDDLSGNDVVEVERESIKDQAAQMLGSDGGSDLDSIIDAFVPLTNGFSGARLRQVCDDAKRSAIKRTGFTKVATPTVADVRAALEADRAEHVVDNIS